MSIFMSYFFFWNIYGAIKYVVPQKVEAYCSVSLANPKSHILALIYLVLLSLIKRMFYGFKSRWRILLERKFLRPSSTSIMYFFASLNSKTFFGFWDWKLYIFPQSQYYMSMKFHPSSTYYINHTFETSKKFDNVGVIYTSLNIYLLF